jgi:hypothetical protein
MAEDDTFMDDVPVEEDSTSITEYDITASPNDFNVLTISSYLDQGAIIIPSIQRFFTWDIQRASKFIESLILGLPIPQIFLFEEQKNRFLILDGQQRLMSIYFFTKMRFPRAGTRAHVRAAFIEHKKIPDAMLQNKEEFLEFRIKLPDRENGTKSPLHGLTYTGLGEYKTRLDLTPVRVVIIKQNEPKDDNSSIKEIYNRLNTGGVNLRPQEMRANLYESDFYRLLYRLNREPEWRRLIGRVAEDDLMRDVELLLRSIAMLAEGPNYAPSMVRFLDRFSGFAKREITGMRLALLENIFCAFLNETAKLPASSFQLEHTNRFSIALFESTLYGVVRPLWEAQLARPISVNGAKLEALAKGIEIFLQEGTTKQVNVQGRLEAAKSIFETQS